MKGGFSLSNLTRYKNDETSLSAYEESGLSLTHELSGDDIEGLIAYQDYVCEFYEWVELDPLKLISIIELVTLNMQIHKDSRLVILKKAIRLYYKLRITFDTSTSDESITQLLSIEMNLFPHDDESDLFSKIVLSLDEEGGCIRDGQTIYIHR